ncbi:hypothetical protein L6452_36620 [Arctium lappa]|uniref:Uncharacterized protein n=1 Tax=Arctium lappa TaxID=4217 RepID=A0ACB8Y937_ARCLA|nr:hypothetical protein L6452_36620 [Arctium lappa]
MEGHGKAVKEARGEERLDCFIHQLEKKKPKEENQQHEETWLKQRYFFYPIKEIICLIVRLSLAKKASL